MREESLVKEHQSGEKKGKFIPLSLETGNRRKDVTSVSREGLQQYECSKEKAREEKVGVSENTIGGQATVGLRE